MLRIISLLTFKKLVWKPVVEFASTEDTSCMVRWIQLLPEFQDVADAQRVEAVFNLFSERVDEGNVANVDQLHLLAAFGDDELAGRFRSCISEF